MNRPNIRTIDRALIKQNYPGIIFKDNNKYTWSCPEKLSRCFPTEQMINTIISCLKPVYVNILPPNQIFGMNFCRTIQKKPIKIFHIQNLQDYPKFNKTLNEHKTYTYAYYKKFFGSIVTYKQYRSTRKYAFWFCPSGTKKCQLTQAMFNQIKYIGQHIYPNIKEEIPKQNNEENHFQTTNNLIMSSTTEEIETIIKLLERELFYRKFSKKQTQMELF